MLSRTQEELLAGSGGVHKVIMREGLLPPATGTSRRMNLFSF
jgi:hypothetical protein